MAATSLATVAQASDGGRLDSAGDGQADREQQADRSGRSTLANRGVASARAGEAAELPEGFRDKAVLLGLDEPTNLAFAPDGKVFVTEKGGTIQVFDSIDDPEPTLFADLNVNVMNNYDRGLLGIAVDPAGPGEPDAVYVSYAYDRELRSEEPAPTWGVGNAYDDCPDPPDGPGETDGGCEVSGRVSRLPIGADGLWTGEEEPLVWDWCMQFPSHATGSLVFGPDGMLYASAGEGASYDYEDYGQDVVKNDGIKNPCDDPPNEGGSLRAQDRRTSGDPVGLSGTIIRIDPSTGEAAPDNHLAGSADPNERRIIADGMRNPFRFAFRPGTDDIFVGDVGSYFYEEINHLPSVTGKPRNFGWPCYEGPKKNPGWVALENKAPICQGLYADKSTTKPFFSYARYGQVAPHGTGCDVGSSAVSGIAFATNPGYPAKYRDALTFSDYARGCIWVFGKKADGSPDPTKVSTLVEGAASPVNLVTGPDGDLYYVELGVNDLGYPTNGAGAIHRIHHYDGNSPPVVDLQADQTYGALPLKVHLDASGSVDAEDDELTYAWDLDGDGGFDDTEITGDNGYRTFTSDRTYTVGVRVTDSEGEYDQATIDIYANNFPPVLDVASPTAKKRWRVGQELHLEAGATDPEDGVVPDYKIAWRLAIQHCPSICHTHPTNQWISEPVVDFNAPDHEYPSYLLLTASATDDRGLTATTSFKLRPRATALTFKSRPKRLKLVVGGSKHRTSYKQRFIEHGQFTLSAPKRQKRGGKRFVFKKWSDGGKRTHVVTTPRRPTTYRAIYRRK